MDDPYDLNRFVEAQKDDYERALSEIRSGRKRTHWMWYVFPQLDGLASSIMSKHFAIRSIEEARAYLDHPVLGGRLLECAEAVIGVKGRSAAEIFGSPDDLKLRSSATLFASVLPRESVFDRLLAKYFAGEGDAKTLDLLDRGNPNPQGSSTDRARFEVRDVFEITNRGRCVTGAILAGRIKIGDCLKCAGLAPLVVSGVEFADSPSIGESYVGLVFENAPPLSELKSRLAEGSVLEAVD